MALRDRDAESLPTYRTNPGGMPCSVATARAALDADDRALLDEWLAVKPGTPGRRSDRYLAELLTQETGHRVGLQSLGHHRRGGCRCSRDQS